MQPVFNPHEYQGNAIRFGAPLDRFNLLMSPGMGKTATSIEIMNIRSTREICRLRKVNSAPSAGMSPSSGTLLVRSRLMS